MARILLIGQGRLPSPTDHETSFPQLRFRNFHKALTNAGHTVLAAGVQAGQATQGPTSATNFIVDTTERRWEQVLRDFAKDAQIIVSAGPFLPGKVACRIADGRPTWIDLPGDPFAELHALEMAEHPHVDVERHNAAISAAHAVLARADAISVISNPQRLACLGQLGVLDRLMGKSINSVTNGAEIVHVMPIAFDLPLPQLPPRTRAHDSPFVVALCGGFNTWFDDETLTTALEQALATIPHLQVLCTGGGLSQHYSAGWDRFRKWQQRSPHRDRIDMKGWVPHQELVEILSEAHVGICLDRPGIEALFGSRTRVLTFAWLGMEVIATTGSELTSRLAAAGAIHAVPEQDPKSVVAALQRLSSTGCSGDMNTRTVQYLTDNFSLETCTESLLTWCQNPTQLTPKADEVENFQFREEAESKLRDIYQSRTWKTLSWAHTILKTISNFAQSLLKLPRTLFEKTNK